MKKTSDKRNKSVLHKIDELLIQVAFAEAGELYCHKDQKNVTKKGNNKHIELSGIQSKLFLFPSLYPFHLSPYRS